MSISANKLRFRPVVEELESRKLLAVLTVTNTGDSGPGSLRQAIVDANATNAADEIHFQLSENDVTIRPLEALPVITSPVVIDGTTQPGFVGVPLIEIDGTSAGPRTFGLEINTDDSSVNSLVVNRFSGHGIRIRGARNSVSDSYIGTTLDGTQRATNGFADNLFNGSG